MGEGVQLYQLFIPQCLDREGLQIQEGGVRGVGVGEDKLVEAYHCLGLAPQPSGEQNVKVVETFSEIFQ